jgi:hypothetical protein
MTTKSRTGQRTSGPFVAPGMTNSLTGRDIGTPTAVILPLAYTDLETVALSTNPDFIALIERSRARAAAEGGVSIAEMRRRGLDAP